MKKLFRRTLAFSLQQIAAAIAIFWLSGCSSVLMGNVRPVEEPAPIPSKKSDEALLTSPWVRLSAKKETSSG
ncbi:MAG: hypothetical protein KGQ59_08775, partial [Bdellovibrionales bacterium]|nr:hypothetical protein [Bdellovibrionales bacterium]